MYFVTASVVLCYRTLSKVKSYTWSCERDTVSPIAKTMRDSGILISDLIPIFKEIVLNVKKFTPSELSPRRRSELVAS